MYSKRTIFKTAWTLFTSQDITFSDALKLAWKKEKVENLLYLNDQVQITFIKRDGEIVTRTGTKNMARNLGKSSKSTGLVLFYSNTDNAIRSFKIERLILAEAI